jgi:aspartyl-tRNA(Asn)/glutamyl-tRNA(Gln) amidotransferase subunit C
MQGRIDSAMVRKVAELARLQLTEEEIGEFSIQLSAILEYFQKMSELPTEGEKPLAHCLPVANRFREDVPTGSLKTALALQNAPGSEEGFFKVPPILESGPSA